MGREEFFEGWGRGVFGVQSENVPISALPQLLGTKSAQRNMQQTSKYNQHSGVITCGCKSNTRENKEIRTFKKTYKNEVHVNMGQ